MQADAIFVAGLRRGADIRLAVRFVPVIQPVCKAYLRPQLVRRNAAELRLERRQLFGALALALAKDGLCFRVAVIVVRSSGDSGNFFRVKGVCNTVFRDKEAGREVFGMCAGRGFRRA